MDMEDAAAETERSVAPKRGLSQPGEQEADNKRRRMTRNEQRGDEGRRREKTKPE